MAIVCLAKNVSGSLPIFWRAEKRVLPSGYRPAQTFASGTVIPAGTFLQITANKTAYVVKTEKLIEVADAKHLKVAKGTLFAAGDIIGKVGGSAGYTIASVDTSNADYDVLVFGSNTSSLAANDVIQECAADSGTASYTPNAVVAEDLEIGKGAGAFAVAYDCVLLKDYLSKPIPDTWLTGGVVLKGNPNIVIANQ